MSRFNKKQCRLRYLQAAFCNLRKKLLPALGSAYELQYALGYGVGLRLHGK